MWTIEDDDYGKIQLAMKAVTRFWNWFPEHDEKLDTLARNGQAEEIREWADEIRSTPDEGWPQDFCDDVGELMAELAQAVEAARREVTI